MQPPIATSLDIRIYDRVTKRLGKRVRNLSVQVKSGCVYLTGECSTFYTKQLIRQAVLGIIENESVINNVVVSVPKNQATI